MKHFLTNRRNDLGFNFFEDAFDSFFKPFNMGTCSMKTDVKETDNGYELSVDMPGYDKGDIELSLENGYLTVKAERAEKQEEKDSFVRRERSYSCSRTFYVGDAVTEEDVKAKYINGTLVLDLPKKEKELPQKKTIQID